MAMNPRRWVSACRTRGRCRRAMRLDHKTIGLRKHVINDEAGRARDEGRKARLIPSDSFLRTTAAFQPIAPNVSQSPRRKRLIAHVPHGHWLAALRRDRIDAPWVLDGPINGEAFKTYVRNELLKTLKPGDIVVLDNLG